MTPPHGMSSVPLRVLMSGLDTETVRGWRRRKRKRRRGDARSSLMHKDLISYVCGGLVCQPMGKS